MIKNFKPIDGKEGFATVEVSMFGLFKKVKIVYKDGPCWRYLDSGEYTPGYVVEGLESKHKAEIRFK